MRAGRPLGIRDEVHISWEEKVAFNPEKRASAEKVEKGTWSVLPRGDEQLNIPRWLVEGRRNRSLHSDWSGFSFPAFD